MEIFNRLSDDVFKICDNLRINNRSLALEMYMTLFYEITTKNLNQEYENYKQKIEFIDMLNFTELYYNIAKLKWDSGDYDNAIYYIVHADIQNSKHNNEARGTFIKLLLNSKGLVFWNVVPNMSCDFRNSRFDYAIADIIGIDSSNIYEMFNKYEGYIRELLNDFEPLILLQFLNSVNRYHNFMGEKPNEYKTLREFKILGELSWLFECYLKDKFNISEHITLSPLIENYLFANSEELLKKFRYYANLKVPSFINKDEYNLQYMLKELNIKHEPSEQIVIYIRITYLFRNYSSHNIEDTFFKPNKDNHSMQFYMIILSSFLMAYKLINNK